MGLTTKLQDNTNVLHSFQNASEETFFLFHTSQSKQVQTLYSQLCSLVAWMLYVEGDEIFGRFQKYQAKVLKISGPIKT